MERTKEITLTSGGRAWAWRELLWSDELRRSTFVLAGTPEAALDRIRKKRQREIDESQGIAPGTDPEVVLTDEDLNEAARYHHFASTEELRISIERWENVRDPQTGEQLRFPEDLGRLGMRDASQLLAGSRAALIERAPDPNASGDRSPSGSAKTTGPSIPNGPRRSRRRG